MKVEGKFRQLLNPATGSLEWSPYPATREEAIAEDVAKYNPMDICPEHKERSVVFVVSGLRSCCSHRLAAAEYNEAINVYKEPKSVAEAQAMKLNFYWIPQPNKYCGHPGKVLLNGKCWFCRRDKDNSPRQKAIRQGLKWYMPKSDDPCPSGHIALRRVDNGKCKACAEVAVQRSETGEVPMHKQFPDMILTRDAARSLGMKVYRTGDPCRRGHRAWRYVSTGGCLDCKEGVPAVQGVV